MSDSNRNIIRRWIDAFNSADPEAMANLYADDAIHTSPKLRVKDPASGGRLVGKDALRDWWSNAFSQPPPIKYELLTLVESDGVVAIEYLRHRDGESPMHVAEIFEISEGKIVRSHVYHG